MCIKQRMRQYHTKNQYKLFLDIMFVSSYYLVNKRTKDDQSAHENGSIELASEINIAQCSFRSFNEAI